MRRGKTEIVEVVLRTPLGIQCNHYLTGKSQRQVQAITGDGTRSHLYWRLRGVYLKKKKGAKRHAKKQHYQKRLS